MSLTLTSPLVLASHNAGKLREIEALLAPLGMPVKSAAALGLPEPEETGDTFEANSALKAVAAATACGLTALADDSGLCVLDLDGAPGIYSARWAGENKDFAAAMQAVDAKLRARGVATQGAKAYFVCALTLADTNGRLQHMRGEVHGTLTYPPRGEKGFGYDPMFIPDGYAQTFGEMDPVEKYRISHRTRAFAALQDFLKSEHAA